MTSSGKIVSVITIIYNSYNSLKSLDIPLCRSTVDIDLEKGKMMMGGKN